MGIASRSDGNVTIGEMGERATVCITSTAADDAAGLLLYLPLILGCVLARQLTGNTRELLSIAPASQVFASLLIHHGERKLG